MSVFSDKNALHMKKWKRDVLQIWSAEASKECILHTWSSGEKYYFLSALEYNCCIWFQCLAFSELLVSIAAALAVEC